MKNYLFVLFLFLPACKSADVKQPICAVQTTLAGAFASTVSNALSCTNKEKIQADIMSSLGSVNLCTSTKGPIGTILCPIAVNQINVVLKHNVPSTWGCKLNDTTSLSQALMTVCNQVITFNK